MMAVERWQLAWRTIKVRGLDCIPPMPSEDDDSVEARPEVALAEIDRLLSEKRLGAAKAAFAKERLLALKAAVETSAKDLASKEKQQRTLENRLAADAKMLDGGELNVEEGVEALEARLQEMLERSEEEANRCRDRAEAASGEARAQAQS